VNNLVGGHFG
jgi:hypothetical protein